MFCSAVLHCLIAADTKRENTYHLKLMYRAGGRGCQSAEEDPARWGWLVPPPDKKRNGDGLMTAEADGESHLLGQRSHKLHSEARKMRVQRSEKGFGVCLYVSFI